MGSIAAGPTLTAGSWGKRENSLGDFPGGIACGTAEVEFLSFDPITNFQGACGDSDGGDECYANIIGLYEGDHGSAWAAASNLETQLQVQATCEQCFDDQPGDLGRDRSNLDFLLNLQRG